MFSYRYVRYDHVFFQLRLLTLNLLDSRRIKQCCMKPVYHILPLPLYIPVLLTVNDHVSGGEQLTAFGTTGITVRIR
jgi:hypothetical protein